MLAGDQTLVGTLYADYNSVIDLNGHTLTLAGTATEHGYLTGPGTLAVTGTMDATAIALTGTGAELLDEGLITDLTGSTRLGNVAGDNTTLAIAAGGTYDIIGNSNIGANGTAVIDNAGLLEKTDSRGQTYVYPGLTSTGTLLVASGTLDLLGASQLGGRITGAGELMLSSGAMTLAAGASVDVGTLGGTTRARANSTCAAARRASTRWRRARCCRSPRWRSTTAAPACCSTGNASYGGRLILGSAGITMGGFTLTLSGTNDSLRYYNINDGVIDVTGTADHRQRDDPSERDAAGQQADHAGRLSSSSAAPRTDNATIVIDTGATYDLLNDTYINAHWHGRDRQCRPVRQDRRRRRQLHLCAVSPIPARSRSIAASSSWTAAARSAAR